MEETKVDTSTPAEKKEILQNKEVDDDDSPKPGTYSELIEEDR